MTAPTLIGTPVSRVDGREKITGAAKYAADLMKGNQIAHAFLVGSPIAGGRITNMDTLAAERAPGVLLILTHKNADRFKSLPTDLGPGGVAAESRSPLSDNCIYYAGQCIAVVVAETAEQARFAASLLDFVYEKDSWAVTMQDAHDTLYKPKQFMHEDLQLKRGDFDSALAAADVRFEGLYRTPVENACALEPHATIAEWIDGRLRVYNSTQFIVGDAARSSHRFRHPAGKSRSDLPLYRWYVRLEGSHVSSHSSRGRCCPKTGTTCSSCPHLSGCAHFYPAPFGNNPEVRTRRHRRRHAHCHAALHAESYFAEG